MTKKTQNIIKKYEEKLDTHKFMYKNNFYTFKRLQKELREEQHQLENMLSNMYFYGLISDKDHEELTGLPFEIANKIICDILGITC